MDADVEHPEEAHEKAVLEDELLDELDFDSDSGPEFFDNISVQSTPRPHLRLVADLGRSRWRTAIFFNHSRSFSKCFV